MAAIAGKFEFTKQENGKEFYTAVGTSEEFATKSATTSCTLEVIQDGNKISLITRYANKVNTVDCVLGQSFKDKMPNGMELDSVASLEGNKLTIKSDKEGKYIGQRVYEFTASEVIVTVTAIMTPVVCKRYYKKL